MLSLWQDQCHGYPQW